MSDVPTNCTTTVCVCVCVKQRSFNHFYVDDHALFDGRMMRYDDVVVDGELSVREIKIRT